MKFRPELPIATLVLLAVAMAGCQSSASDPKAASASDAPAKPKRTYSAPVYQTGSLIPVNRGGYGSNTKNYNPTNGTPALLDTQRLNSGAPAGVRGN